MGREVRTLTNLVRSIHLQHRAIYHIVSTVVFEYGWKNVPEKEQENLYEILTKPFTSTRLEEVRQWYKRNHLSFVSELNITELRRMAQEQGMKNWSRRSKLELLSLLEVS